MRVLVTGAAGGVGRAVRRELAAAGHSLRLADVRAIENPEGESLRLDIRDGEAVLQAMQGMEAVVHLAFGSAGFDNSLKDIHANFDVNAKGTYLLLWAAKQTGVKRFVYTSTLSIFGGTNELARGQFNEPSPANPTFVYGLTKYMGEEACQMYARHYGLSVVCLRLCNVKDDTRWRELQKQGRPETNDRGGVHRGMATHVDDVARAIHLSLTASIDSYEVLHIAADNPGRVTEIERAKQVLGFWPKYKLDAP